MAYWTNGCVERSRDTGQLTKEFRMRSNRGWRLCREMAILAGLASVASAAFSQQAAAASGSQAKAPEYKILGPDEVLLEAGSKAVDCINSYRRKNQNGGACIAEVKLNGVPAASPPIQVCGQGWFLLTFPQGSMAPDQQYLLTYREVAGAGGSGKTERRRTAGEAQGKRRAKRDHPRHIRKDFCNPGFGQGSLRIQIRDGIWKRERLRRLQEPAVMPPRPAERGTNQVFS